MRFVYYCSDMQIVQDFFISTFNNPIWATLLISVLPIFELRGAIPFGMSSALWGAKALNIGTSFLVGFLGSSAVVPIIALVFKPILNYLKQTKIFKKFANKLENKIAVKGCKIASKNSTLKKMLGIILFVGVPLPLTGVYTGTMIAVLIGLKFKDVLISVLLGNLLAGVIIAIFSSISSNASTIILLTFAIVVIFIFTISSIKFFVGLNKNKKDKQNV